jgi:very-short-patch-repair endonuclease
VALMDRKQQQYKLRQKNAIDDKKRRKNRLLKRPRAEFEGEGGALRLSSNVNRIGIQSRAENALSTLLKESGVSYTREVQLGKWSVDFVVPGRIVVEVDGVFHEAKKESDSKKVDFLERNGFLVLRIPAHEAHKKETAEFIRRMCLERTKNVRR